jgi:hypothetical protein
LTRTQEAETENKKKIAATRLKNNKTTRRTLGFRETLAPAMLAFVACYRLNRADGTALHILKFLLEEMGVDVLVRECDSPGCLASKFPLIPRDYESLASHAPERAATEEILNFLVQKCLVIDDRDCFSPLVFAANRGNTSASQALVRAVVTAAG